MKLFKSITSADVQSTTSDSVLDFKTIDGTASLCVKMDDTTPDIALDCYQIDSTDRLEEGDDMSDYSKYCLDDSTSSSTNSVHSIDTVAPKNEPFSVILFSTEALHGGTLSHGMKEPTLPDDVPGKGGNYTGLHEWIDETPYAAEIHTGSIEGQGVIPNKTELVNSIIDKKYNDRLRKARYVSYFGFTIAVIQGSIAMGYGISNSMISLTAMGAQICIDLLSSVMVVWRFYSHHKEERRNPKYADEQYRFREALRERRAALGVGVLLFATSLWTSAWGFIRVFKVPPIPSVRLDRALVAMSVAWPGFFVFGVIAVVKWMFALNLRSRVLSKDAVCTTFGAALSLVTALFATIDLAVSRNATAASNTGAADSVAALIMASLIMVEGIRTIYQNSVGWIPPNGVTKQTIHNYYLTRNNMKPVPTTPMTLGSFE